MYLALAWPSVRVCLLVCFVLVMYLALACFGRFRILCFGRFRILML